jgi:hypothetical protein
VGGVALRSRIARCAVSAMALACLGSCGGGQHRRAVCTSVQHAASALAEMKGLAVIELNEADLAAAYTPSVRDLPVVDHDLSDKLTKGVDASECPAVTARLDVAAMASSDELRQDLKLPEGWAYAVVEDGGAIDTDSRAALAEEKGIRGGVDRLAGFVDAANSVVVVQYEQTGVVYSVVLRPRAA